MALQQRHDTERGELSAKQKAERGELFSGDWKGKGEAKNRAKSFVATQQAAEKLELQDRQRAEREALQAKYKPLPMYKQWREQPQIVGLIVLPVVDQHAERGKQVTVAKTLRSLTHTVDARQHITYQLDRKDVFRDEGRTIAILDLNSERGIAAALATAQQKYGNVLTVTGSDSFKQNAVAVAVANGLTCKFADPQLEAMREQLQQQKYQAAREAARAERERIATEQKTTKAVTPTPALVAEKPKRVSWLVTKQAEQAAKAVKTTVEAPAIPPIQQPGEAVSLDPGPQTPDPIATPPEAQPAEQLPTAPTAEQWIAANAPHQVAAEAFAKGDGKTEYVVKYVAAGKVVIDHGQRRLAIYPKPDGDDLHAGDSVVIDKGTLSHPAERQNGDIER